MSWCILQDTFVRLIRMTHAGSTAKPVRAPAAATALSDHCIKEWNTALVLCCVESLVPQLLLDINITIMSRAAGGPAGAGGAAAAAAIPLESFYEVWPRIAGMDRVIFDESALQLLAVSLSVLVRNL